MQQLLKTCFMEVVNINDTEAFKNIKNTQSSYYILTQDLKQSNEPFKPISFHGTFDGNGHTIQGFKLIPDCETATDLCQVALFSGTCSDDVIKNLIVIVTIDLVIDNTKQYLISMLLSSGAGLIENVQVSSAEQILIKVSPLKVAYGSLIAVSNDMTVIRNCQSVSVVVQSQTRDVYAFDFAYQQFGGLVGQSDNQLDILESKSDFTLTSDALMMIDVGGFIGFARAKVNITRSISVLKHFTVGPFIAGSMIGLLQGKNDAKYTFNVQDVRSQHTILDTKIPTDSSLGFMSTILGDSYITEISNVIIIGNVSALLTQYGAKQVGGKIFTNYGTNRVLVETVIVRVSDSSAVTVYEGFNFTQVWSLNPGQQLGFPYINYKGDGIVGCSRLNQSCGINQFCSGSVVGYICKCKDNFQFIKGQCRISGCRLNNGIPCGDPNQCSVDELSLTAQCVNEQSPGISCEDCHPSNDFVCTREGGRVSCARKQNQAKYAGVVEEKIVCQDNYGGPYCEINEACKATDQSCNYGVVPRCSDSICVTKFPSSYCYNYMGVTFCTDDRCLLGHFQVGCSKCVDGFEFDSQSKQCVYSKGTYSIVYGLTGCQSNGDICAQNAQCNGFLECQCVSGYVSDGVGSCIQSFCTSTGNTLCNGGTCNIVDSQGSFCQDSESVQVCTSCHTTDSTACTVKGSEVNCIDKITCKQGYGGKYCELCISCYPGVIQCAQCQVKSAAVCMYYPDYKTYYCPQSVECKDYFNFESYCQACVAGSVMKNGLCVKSSNQVVIISIISVVIILLIIIVAVVTIVLVKKNQKKNSKKKGRNAPSASDNYKDVVNNWRAADNAAQDAPRRGQRAPIREGSSTVLSRNDSDVQLTRGRSTAKLAQGATQSRGRPSTDETGDVQLTRGRGRDTTTRQQAEQRSNYRSDGSGEKNTRGRGSDVTGTRGRGGDATATSGRGEVTTTRGRQIDAGRGKKVDASGNGDVQLTRGRATATRETGRRE